MVIRDDGEIISESDDDDCKSMPPLEGESDDDRDEIVSKDFDDINSDERQALVSMRSLNTQIKEEDHQQR